MIGPMGPRICLHLWRIGNGVLAVSRVLRHGQSPGLPRNPLFERAGLFASTQAVRADQKDAAREKEQRDGGKRTSENEAELIHCYWPAGSIELTLMVLDFSS